MYRIVREENKLSGKVQYIIEKRRKFLWMTSWSTDLGLDITQRGPVGATTYSGAKWKMNQIISCDGITIKREVQ